ncbi:hypothetical protein ACFSNO_28840 [Streptomyces cirratus]
MRWYLDGHELKRFAGRSDVRVGELSLSGGRTHKLTVTAEDRTPSVRDPKIAASLRTTVGWSVRR